MALKPYIKRVLGLPQLPTQPVSLTNLVQNWIFEPSRPSPMTALRRCQTRYSYSMAPAVAACKPITPHVRWIAYFIYLPNGGLTSAHMFTLRRLREGSAKLMVICASPTPANVPSELDGMTDALYWKALPGFDFSAYTIAVHEVARLSPGADLLLINDSVFGPFGLIDDIWPRMRWGLTGFTASGKGQSHVQAYAFYLAEVNERRRDQLSTIFCLSRAFNHYEPVVLQQETRLAQIASCSMSVGALWYADPDISADISLFAALPLVEAGFPFLKRALLSKHRGIYPTELILDTLRRFGHPAP